MSLVTLLRRALAPSAVALASIQTLPAAAHEFWILPLAYQIDSNSVVAARLVNGTGFEGVEIAYFPDRFQRFTLTLGDEQVDVVNRLASRPAMAEQPLGEGLHVAAYVSTPQIVTWTEWERFTGFVEHKDFEGALETHAARGLPQVPIREVYTRYPKSLIGVGDSAGQDRELGLETEIVALANPYTDDMSAGMPMRVLYQGAIRPDVQIEVFERGPDAAVAITYLRTDDQGIVTVPVKPGFEYLVDAVVLREPSPEVAAEYDAQWETLWADFTFAVPAG